MAILSNNDLKTWNTGTPVTMYGVGDPLLQPAGLPLVSQFYNNYTVTAGTSISFKAPYNIQLLGISAEFGGTPGETTTITMTVLDSNIATQSAPLFNVTTQGSLYSKAWYFNLQQFNLFIQKDWSVNISPVTTNIAVLRIPFQRIILDEVYRV